MLNDRKILLTITCLLLAVSVAPWLHYGRRALVADRFTIKGESMEPTLHTGQRVWVNKLLMGPRIYTKFDFESPELHCIRLPGFRKLRVGDVAVFNYPYGRHGDTIAFKINYVYCKRCRGTPGDTVRIVDSEFRIGPAQSRRVYVGTGSAAGSRLRQTPDSVLLRMRMLRAGQFAGEGERWTTKDFGPIVVPRKGMTIELDSVARRHYARVIDWEERCGKKAARRREAAAAGHFRSVARTLFLPGSGSAPGDGALPGYYTFRQDWYFFVGDNVTNSRDSRFFGFVPADFVVGIVPGK